MSEGARPGEEAKRLENLWAGRFGDDYLGRNPDVGDHRRRFWGDVLDLTLPESVLEVGCNLGANLRSITDHAVCSSVTGLDINELALRELRRRVPAARPVLGLARHLPFSSEAFDLVFTMGVLIHQPDESLADVLAGMVHAARRWILCAEYHAPETTEVPYRGQPGALFKRDYGRLVLTAHPELTLRASGFLDRASGWDDVTWWVFQKGAG